MVEYYVSGVLTRDAETRTLNNGTQLVNLNIAANLAGKPENPQTMFVQATAFGELADKCAKLKKGAKVALYGSARPSFTYTNRQTGEIVCNLTMRIAALDWPPSARGHRQTGQVPYHNGAEQSSDVAAATDSVPVQPEYSRDVNPRGQSSVTAGWNIYTGETPF